MMYNKPIICLSFPAWDGNYTKSTVELMKEISKLQKVTFIDYPYTILDLLKFKNKSIPKSRIITGNGYIDPEFPGLTIYNLPPIIPFQRIKWQGLFNLVLKINSYLINRRIEKIRRKEDIQSAEWISALNPIIGNLVFKKYNSESFHYYCYDDIDSMKWVSKENRIEEKQFVLNSKSVFCSSKNLISKFAKYHPNLILLENGVNLSIFNNYPREWSHSKIVGYIGSIDDRLDINLLTFLIEKNKDYKFQFIGRVMDENIKFNLCKFPNVEFIPAVSASRLPEYISKFSIGLIPFVKNSFTENIFPLKVNEYLSLGVPVISTSFSDLSSLESIIKIAENPFNFHEEMNKEISSDSSDKIINRISFARLQSWQNKAEKMLTTILNLQ